ncbi:Carbamoyltransferase hypF2 [Paraburkholderia piptadeniae]|uniref:Carbamoyltransferase HypF n=2 Tax=Paraburkholderia TaxID=1822464 RepID=A0A7X1NKX4_9BURK|nr:MULTISPECIES: carbamoyltransferase HypF [Paraburkholderia]MPW23752.1 carbamoyltransferase HypF [Paraburkholderia franconis]SIT51895.1 Carbamoyltransferase hypF2 [Paraburkholderia piptadeniae]
MLTGNATAVAPHAGANGPIRWRVRVTGVVQGVGFRPFVYRIATSRALRGWVLNDADGVLMEVEGDAHALADFATALRSELPPLARVASLQSHCVAPLHDATERFVIRDSERSGSHLAQLPADSHVCDACLGEMADPANRRYRYPFINCTNCGPRFSLIKAIPYDRVNTTMRAFTMCTRCEAEYRDPSNRRYHAQPNACPECGPRVELYDADRMLSAGDDALRAAIDALRTGLTVAVKSVGGFHLVVDARNPDAIARLRDRKRRNSKSFALMMASVETARRWTDCSELEAQWLRSPGRPIVLLRKLDGGGLAENVAPRNPNLGVMLPSAPLHYLLLSDPDLPALVMTSGNVSGFPIAYRNEEALARLFEVSDLVLLNDRDIEIRIDDSVIRCSNHPQLPEPQVSFLRRARGFAPYVIEAGRSMAPVVAYGAELKTTVALTDRERIYVSQHIGDLGNDDTFRSHQTIASHLADLYRVKPTVAACDLHPSFRSTRLASDTHVSRQQVQHHHAHMASCLADNGLNGPAIGVILDGAGYGLDGTIWGGEFFIGDARAVQREGHLRYLSLLGGDKAVHEPVRTALALALESFDGDEGMLASVPALAALGHEARHVYATMWRKGINVTRASSMGRLFDGVAALAGVCSRAEYEAHGPIEFEGLLARDLAMSEPYRYAFDPSADAPVELDYRPLVRQVVSDTAGSVELATISRRFHSTIVLAIASLCDLLRSRHALDTVVLSGGVFLNEFLLVNALVELRRRGFDVHAHRDVPTNDGGIALGQAVVASARITAERRAVI